MRRTTRGGLVMATASLLALGVWSSAGGADATGRRDRRDDRATGADGGTGDNCALRADHDPPPAGRGHPGHGRDGPAHDGPAGDSAAGDRPRPAPPVRRGGPAGRDAAGPPRRTPRADPGSRAPAAVPAAAPSPDPTHLPVTGPGGVAILAGLSLVLAAAGLLLRRARRRGRRDPDLPAALRPPARSRRVVDGGPPNGDTVASRRRGPTARRRVRTARMSIERRRRAGDGRRRHPVGRRGQGQVHRPPRQGDGDGRPLPGRPQRRSHHRRRRRDASPSSCSRGVLYDHITPVIGNGVVVDPAVLLAEIDTLDGQGRRLHPAAR